MNKIRCSAIAVAVSEFHYPEVTEMQARAIFEAAAEVQRSGTKVHPEVMIPLVGFKRELELQVEIVRRVAQDVQAAKKVKFSYLVGTMIEVPRGALTADEIAETAEFFSFGTNDLTQTALGMSRDDSGSFLPHYAELEIVKRNPFATIDQNGVGQLMQIAIEKGRKTRPKIKLGICGEHGGDPDSVKFCHRLGLDYVSCSPFRVPIARLAAARGRASKVNRVRSRRPLAGMALRGVPNKNQVWDASEMRPYHFEARCFLKYDAAIFQATRSELSCRRWNGRKRQ